MVLLVSRISGVAASIYLLAVVRHARHVRAPAGDRSGAVMVRIDLTLLGGFQARLSHGPLLTVPTRKAQGLLAYLALPCGVAHPRDKLAALLWGDMREGQARTNLRQTLFML